MLRMLSSLSSFVSDSFWLEWVGAVVLLWIGLNLDDWLLVGKQLASSGVDPLLIGLNEDSLVLCSISERILSRSLLWSVSELSLIHI